MNFPNLLIQLLPETVLVITALVILALSVAGGQQPSNPSRPAAQGAAIAVAGILVAIAAVQITPRPTALSLLLAHDPLAQLAKTVLLALGALAVMLPPAKQEIGHPGEFRALMLFALTGLLLASGTTHLLMLFVALELASLSLYLLAGFPRDARSAEASLKYFLFGGVSAAFMLFGISLLYGFCGGASLTDVAKGLPQSSPLAMAGLLMVLTGLGFKLAAAPFHAWAPDVYEGAPATTVALVAAASKVAGVVVLVRLLRSGFPTAAGSAAWGGMAAGWSLWLAVLAAVSIILGNGLALAQRSVRRLLAYSAVANTGYLLVALCANGRAATASALFFVTVYGLATLGALAVTAAVERDRGDDSRASFAGLVHRSPLQATALLVCLASLAGIPPLAGFTGKFAMFSQALAATRNASGLPGLTWLVALAAAMSAVSLYYYLLVAKAALVTPGANENHPATRLPVFHTLAVALPAAALVALGLFPSILLDKISSSISILPFPP